MLISSNIIIFLKQIRLFAVQMLGISIQHLDNRFTILFFHLLTKIYL